MTDDVRSLGTAQDTELQPFQAHVVPQENRIQHLRRNERDLSHSLAQGTEEEERALGWCQKQRKTAHLPPKR